MRGSVVKKNDHWYVVIEDKDPTTGKRKRRWHSGYRSKREAQAACNELAVAMQRGEYLAPNKQTVGDFVEEWLETIRATVRISTLEKYSRDLRTHVVPYIGFVPLTKLDGANGLVSQEHRERGHDAPSPAEGRCAVGETRPQPGRHGRPSKANSPSP